MRPAREESGQSVIEVLVLGLALLMPLIWLLSVLAEVHAAALATTAAVRDAGLSAARSTGMQQARSAADRAVAAALSHQGLDPALANAHISLPPAMRRGGRVSVEIAYPVTVGRFPLLGSMGGPSVWVRARHLARIDPYRSDP